MKQMNKKGLVGLVALIALGILFLLVIVSNIIERETLDELCKEEGFMEYRSNGEFEYCKDYNGDISFIEHRCSHIIPILDLFPYRCGINTIKVGRTSLPK